VTGLTIKSGQADTFVKKDAAASASLTGNTTWKLMGHSYAEAGALYGSFNNWIQTKNYCAREGDGWSVALI